MSRTQQLGRIKAKALVYFALLLALSASVAKSHAQSSPRSLPGPPARVIAVPLQSTAIVAWLLPETSDDAPPITNYTVTAFDSDAPLTVAATTRALAPGAVVEGVTSNHCYTFTVHATNAAGNGPESQPSESTCLPPIPGADIQITMYAPASSSARSDLAFTLIVTNNGTADAAMVTLTDTLSAPLSSFTTSQGACQGTAGGTSVGCNLGAVSSGASATVTVNVQMGSGQITNTAWVTGLDANGAPLPDPVPNNNMASATVHTGNPG